MAQYHFDPTTYLDMIRAEVPSYDELQEAVVAATADLRPSRLLDLGTGTGATAQRVLAPSRPCRHGRRWVTPSWIVTAVRAASR